MKQSTINRIHLQGTVVIGQYTYKVREAGELIRCKTEDIGRMWIDCSGNQHDAWKTV